ncbi:MAG: C25 family cysteine peptidase, partial [Candidatus Thorarchaeota archaeon]
MKRAYCVVLSLMMAAVVCTNPMTVGSDEDLSADLRTMMVDFHLDLSSLNVVEVDGYDLIKIEGYDSFTNPGEPFLPVKNHVLTFERDTEILSVEAVMTDHRDLSESLTITPTPWPLTWKDPLSREVKRDENIYSSDSTFPGNYFSYEIGRGAENTYLYLHVYPVQFIPKSGKVTIITDMRIEVEYTSKHIDEIPMQGFGSECVIITPAELYSQAVDLASFHEASIGISTTVVNTTWIYSNYGEAGDPPYPGYWDNTLVDWESIVNYNYSLAKRIVSFLGDESEHPNLSYVLLYGNGSLVPPSFYYYTDFFAGYDAWIPTDFFYGSPDYDLAPNLLVGRLPVNDSQVARHVNEKIVRWLDNLTGSWTNNIVVAGGRPHVSSFFVGELIVLDSVNRGFFEGSNLTKMFRSDYTFSTEDLLTAFAGEFSLTYLISHGGGDSIFLNESIWTPPPDREYLNVSDIMNLEENSNLSVVLSIACDNGAFDNGVVVNRTFESPVSFGESLIFSRAGAIAYMGGSRINAGNPSGTL